MQPVKFLLRSNLKSGIGEFENLPKYISSFGFDSVGIIVDKAVKNVAYVKNVLDDCRHSLINCEIMTYDLDGEPTYGYLDSCVEKFRGFSKIQALIGLGGGSAMDLAKGIALLLTNPGKAITYRGFPDKVNDPLPVIGIPTTAGTGSETTYNAVFLDTAEHKKLGINTIKNFPILSILDPKLISSCPLKVMISSGMDAVTHAVEAFVAKKATILSRMFSIEAYRLLSRNLKKVKNNSQDLEVLGNLQLGAYLAIVGLANSSAGPAGGLSYLLGARYRVPHGLAGAIFLPRVQQFNLEHGYTDYALLAGADNCSSLSSRAQGVIEELFELNQLFAVPDRLKTFGVQPGDLEKFVQGCLGEIKGAFEMNPVRMNEEDIRGILKDFFA